MVLSLVGDQIAVVALTWLVYETSASPLLAAATFAISYLPWLVGGPLLSGLADRLPRRELMIACDLARAGLVLAMVLPGMPIWALCALLFATELLSPPFTAARAALVPDILPDDRYVLGTAITNVTQMAGQVFGFAAAGILVAALRPSASLAINAATFLASAAIVGLGIRRRPAARGERAAVRGMFSDAATGLRLVLGRADLRSLTGFGLLCVFYVVPEGLAVPYARELGGGAAAAGLLLAAAPFGSALGGLAFGRFVAPSRRLQLMGPAGGGGDRGPGALRDGAVAAGRARRARRVRARQRLPARGQRGVRVGPATGVAGAGVRDRPGRALLRPGHRDRRRRRRRALLATRLGDRRGRSPGRRRRGVAEPHLAVRPSV
jgi:MFS family permease